MKAIFTNSSKMRGKNILGKFLECSARNPRNFINI
jgi:hypothetical protein